MSPNRREPWLFNRLEDLHCVVYHLLVVGAYALAFAMYLWPTRFGLDTGAEFAAFVAVCVVMLGWVSALDIGVNYHNHVHRPVFRFGWLNQWFGRLWTVTGGWPAFYWWYAHVVVHHAHLLHETDWTLPRRRADGTHEGIYRYCLRHWPWRYAAGLAGEFTGPRGRRYAGTAVREGVLFLALWSVPWWIDPGMAFWLWLLPQWFGNAVVMGAGMYVQHVHCVPKSAAAPVGHSNTFLSRFFNRVLFNIGYHAEHHDHPNVHWADLPAAHAARKPELIRGHAHVVPGGYFAAAWNTADMAVWRDPAGGPPTFRCQHPEYLPPADLPP